MSLISKGRRSWKRWLAGKRRDSRGVFGLPLHHSFKKQSRGRR